MNDPVEGELYKATNENIESWKHFEYNFQENVFIPKIGYCFKTNDLFLCVLKRPNAIRSYIFLHLVTGKFFTVYETHIEKLNK